MYAHDPHMDPAHKSCHATLPRHLAQRSCKDSEPPMDVLCWAFVGRILLKDSKSCQETLPREILSRDSAVRACTESLPRNDSRDLAQRSCKNQRHLASLLLEILPRGLQRFPFKKSCRGCSLLVEGPLGVLVGRSYQEILSFHLLYV